MAITNIKDVTDAVDRAMRQMESPSTANIDNIPVPEVKTVTENKTHPHVEEMINGLESTFTRTAERLENLSALFFQKGEELKQRAAYMRELTTSLPPDIRQAVEYELECHTEIRRLAHIK